MINDTLDALEMINDLIQFIMIEESGSVLYFKIVLTWSATDKKFRLTAAIYPYKSKPRSIASEVCTRCHGVFGDVNHTCYGSGTRYLAGGKTVVVAFTV